MFQYPILQCLTCTWTSWFNRASQKISPPPLRCAVCASNPSYPPVPTYEGTSGSKLGSARIYTKKQRSFPSRQEFLA